MASDMAQAANPTTEEKLSLLKKAYRSLKQESERREEAMAAERAAAQRERGALLSRVDELTRELESLRESVRRAGHEARERLLEDQIGRMDMAQGHPASSDELLISSSDGALGLPGAGTGLLGGGGGASGSGSYQQGMAFKSALSTSLESVQGLAIPASVHLQLQRQAARIDDHARHAQALWLDLCEAQASLAQAHAATQAERHRAEAAIQEGEAARAAAEATEAVRQEFASALAAAQAAAAAAAQAHAAACEVGARREADARRQADEELKELREALAVARRNKGANTAAAAPAATPGAGGGAAGAFCFEGSEAPSSGSGGRGEARRSPPNSGTGQRAHAAPASESGHDGRPLSGQDGRPISGHDGQPISGQGNRSISGLEGAGCGLAGLAPPAPGEAAAANTGGGNAGGSPGGECTGGMAALYTTGVDCSGPPAIAGTPTPSGIGGLAAPCGIGDRGVGGAVAAAATSSAAGAVAWVGAFGTVGTGAGMLGAIPSARTESPPSAACAPAATRCFPAGAPPPDCTPHPTATRPAPSSTPELSPLPAGAAPQHALSERSASQHSLSHRSSSQHSLSHRSASQHSLSYRSASQHSLSQRSSSQHSLLDASGADALRWRRSPVNGMGADSGFGVGAADESNGGGGGDGGMGGLGCLVGLGGGVGGGSSMAGSSETLGLPALGGGGEPAFLCQDDDDSATNTAGPSYDTAGGDGSPRGGRGGACAAWLAQNGAPVATRLSSFAAAFGAGTTAEEAAAAGEGVRRELEATEELGRPLWPGGWPAAALGEGLERFLMGMLYSKAFGVGADVVEDKVLNAQLTTLAFVGPAHLGLDPSLCHGTEWEAAIAQLLRVAEFTAPVDKMRRVVSCCHHLGALVAPTDGSFVRLLALAILRARPDRLHSSLEYTARFVDPHQLWSAEAGGHFTIARAAVQYLAHLDPEALSASPHH